MRTFVAGLITAAAVMTVGATSASACGGGLLGSFGSGCSPCGGAAYVSPCGGGGYFGSYGGYNVGYGYGGGYGGYGYGGASYQYQYLPRPTVQYYHVNQGPVYAGPGNFAPYPTYQERAVSGWYGSPRAYGYGYGYDGGPYGDAATHLGGAISGPAIYSYRWPRAHRPWRPRPMYYGYQRSSYQHGYRAGPRFGHAPLRRMY